MNKKILCLEQGGFKPLPKPFALEVAAYGCELIHLSSIQMAQKKIDELDNLFCLVSNAPALSIFKNFAEKNSSARAILVTDLPMRSYSQHLENREFLYLDHVIANNSKPEWAQNDLRITLQKIIRKDYWGIEKYFVGPYQSGTICIEKSKGRDLVKKEVLAFADRFRFGSNLSKNIASTVEEMLMNAVFDAPKAAGVFKYKSIFDKEGFILDEEHRPILDFGFDGKTFALGITDPFGAFQRDIYFKYLRKTIKRDQNKEIIDDKLEGAGLGLFKILYNSKAIIANIEMGKKTQIISLMQIDEQLRDVSHSTRTIHFFKI